MVSSKVQSLFRYQWGHEWLSRRPVGIQSKVFADTSQNSDETYYCTLKGKSVWIYLQGLFSEHIIICFIEPSSLPFAFNLMITLGTVVLEQRNVSAMSLSMYPSPCKVTIKKKVLCSLYG